MEFAYAPSISLAIVLYIAVALVAALPLLAPAKRIKVTPSRLPWEDPGVPAARFGSLIVWGPRVGE